MSDYIKKAARARMAVTGEKYVVARRAVIAEHEAHRAEAHAGGSCDCHERRPQGPRRVMREAGQVTRMDAAWQQVTCRRCPRTYQCTPENDYFDSTTLDDGLCQDCLLADSGRNPETTPVPVVDGNGAEVDPRDLRLRSEAGPRRPGPVNDVNSSGP